MSSRGVCQIISRRRETLEPELLKGRILGSRTFSPKNLEPRHYLSFRSSAHSCPTTVTPSNEIFMAKLKVTCGALLFFLSVKLCIEIWENVELFIFGKCLHRFCPSGWKCSIKFIIRRKYKGLYVSKLLFCLTLLLFLNLD